MARRILKPKCSALCTITDLWKIHLSSSRHAAPPRAFTDHWKNARNRPGQATQQQRGGNAVANLEAAFRSASGDGFVSRCDRPAAGRCTEDQKFLYQVAAGSAEDSVAGDDRAANYATDARISQNCERCLHAALGWEASLADRDAEIFEAAGTATASATDASAAKTRTCR